jgi:transcriptional regulator with XRE-family HTH domain
LSRMKRRGIPTLGERITSLMVASGLNTSELSARTDISVSYLSRIIQGEVVNPTIDFVMRIAAGLGVTENELLREDEGDKYAGGKEPRGGRPTIQRPTQITAAPSTRLNAPLSTSHKEILMQRLEAAKKRVEEAEKTLQVAAESLQVAHEELREIGAFVDRMQEE